MNYVCVEPEVAGGFGPNTVLDASSNCPAGFRVQRLHYVFHGWLGDELLTSTPCFVVTERLAEMVVEERLTGAMFESVEVARSEIFDELYPTRCLPTFLWMKVVGRSGRDDLFLTQDARLVMSARAWELIRPFAQHATVAEFNAG